MKDRLAITAACLVIVSCGCFAGEARTIKGSNTYAVVVSEKTFEDGGWLRVVESLRRKHNATVIVYPGDVKLSLKALQEVFPRYACFVAQPAEAGRGFVVSVHRLTRQLDDDPYTDVLWGILTGYEAKDALWIAEARKPLTVRRGLAGTGLDLNRFESGAWYSEGRKNHMVEKAPGGKPAEKQCPGDTTMCFVDEFNKKRPDLFLTSGHATERDWQIGYSYKNGQLRCKTGMLLGVDTKGKAHAINSPNPKVYLPVGNCLIGHVKDRESMALALMRTGGVHQMAGYTVVTWYGYMGWGVKDLFIGQPGRFTFAEAFYFNQQALLHQLQTRFPKSAGINFERFGHRDIGGEAARNGLFNEKKSGFRSMDDVGLLWDRDTVAFYGDPAWQAKMVQLESLPWEQKVSAIGGKYTFKVAAVRDGSWPGRPIMQWLPHRIKDVKIIKGADLKPVITDNFILLPLSGTFKQGGVVEVVFEAARIGP